ncbi:sulfite reductase (ferredoxin) [Pseudarcicella hirudinis]|uniref:Sulfite reductase (Ferredoxin) n=1 Tax=Pseudarcicella hirudinis TaxID=1079859 RepID=A0A1I5QGG4_9BACT|nr:HEPN domain-containing protein [Pseudarcicella hirudinis]SFP45080.1 sulfite reductase (ferredoxin) [Pseudarcicella hirudinis]
MQSFRTELENPLVEKDIVDLARKIQLFREGKIHEEKFRSLRLARGVYGQRQQGVQMVRIKLPYGKMTFRQWKRISDISDEYSTGNLHLTTRQDIQIHFVSLDRTPELWSKLEQDDVTLREACGNTVRNVTASPTAGIDKNEPFDVTPHADAVFRYFLRNPICQEMGRKFKIAFSNTDEDTALTYMHDMGFIPKIKDGKRGFKVVLGGGLGAQPMLAQLSFEFLEENQIIPYLEATLRVFDRHGERNSRNKARMKFLIQKIGFEKLTELIKSEWKALKNKAVEIDITEGAWALSEDQFPSKTSEEQAPATSEYEIWKATNTFEQKQSGYYGVYVRILNGNVSSVVSRSLVDQLEGYIGDDVRVTINQGLMLKFVPEANLPYVFSVLKAHDLAAAGANSIANITACPGTDTCNLAISDSTNITSKLEEVITGDFPDLIHNNNIKIKISGCMNSCGQHGMANIGFHGSSLKSADKRVLPALQVLLGGGTLGDGVGRVADKVIKVPSKRGPEVLRVVLNNYEENALEGEYFNDYYDRQGEKYFYALLKPVADLTTLKEDDFIDWGASEQFQTEIGVGECASVIIDLVATLLFESEEKYTWTEAAYEENRWADSIYHAYSVFVSAAKALLLDKSISASTQSGVIDKFEENFVATNEISLGGKTFRELVLQINQNEPSPEFARSYVAEAKAFLELAKAYREQLVVNS